MHPLGKQTAKANKMKAASHLQNTFSLAIMNPSQLLASWGVMALRNSIPQGLARMEFVQV